MRHAVAAATLAGLLGVLLFAGDAQAFGHKKKAACAPAPCVQPCPPPPCYEPCPPPPPCPPPQPVVYCPPPVVYCPPPPCPPPVVCETPKKKCGLFGGGGLFGGHGKKRAAACAPAHHVVTVSYAAPACGSCSY